MTSIWFVGAPSTNKRSLSNLKIVDGHDTDIAQHPWQVSLQYLRWHICGGVLIADQWVLTAAHCVNEPITLKNLTVRLGSTLRNSTGKLMNIKKVILHYHFYVFKKFENDIALVQLDSQASGPNIKPIALPSPDLVIPTGAAFTVTGWGSTSERGNASLRLQELTIPSVNITQCQAEISQFHISENNLCAGFEEGGKGTCVADDGSPAVYKNQVVGLVSFSAGCARLHSPTVFGRVSKYVTWIQKNIT